MTNLSTPIVLCTLADFNQILTDIEDFWGTNRTLAFHHPLFLHEFGNTCFVIKLDNQVLAYLFGFLSQTENLGYVHLVGVREKYQRQGLGEKLYAHFIQFLKTKNISAIKAITTPTNEKSIRFHTKLGMRMLGNEIESGIKIVNDYSGKGQDRVVFRMEI